MQIKIFTIPIIGGERISEEMNVFLRSKKVLQVQHKLIKLKKEAFWSFYVKYVEDFAGAAPGGEREKINYRETLDEASFSRFLKMRDVRRELAKAENIPAYTILTDAQMAAIAQMEEVSIAKMKTVKGLGEKTAEKYGKHFMALEI